MKLVQKYQRGDSFAKAIDTITRVSKNMRFRPTFGEEHDAIYGLARALQFTNQMNLKQALKFYGRFDMHPDFYEAKGDDLIRNLIYSKMGERPMVKDEIDSIWRERTKSAPTIFFKEHPELQNNKRVRDILSNPWKVQPTPVYKLLENPKYIGHADLDGKIIYGITNPFNMSHAIHEDHHAWRALLQKEVDKGALPQWFAGDDGGYDQRETLLLKLAYPMSQEFAHRLGYPVGERGALNAQVRHYLETNGVDPLKLDVKPLNEVFREAIKEGLAYGTEVNTQLDRQKALEMLKGKSEEEALKKQNSNILSAITRVGGIAIPALYVIDKKVSVKRFGGNIQKAQGGGPLARKSIEIAQKLKRAYGPLGWRTAWYNNITPGSYHADLSWHPKGKILGEIPNALVDYVLGKGRKEAPKWKKAIEEAFDNKQDLTLRKEAFKIYQGIPHKEHYIINTGKTDESGHPIFHLNVEEIPHRIQHFINDVAVLDNKHFISQDPANYGGNVNVTKTTKGNNFYLKLDDVWDVNPFKEPGRIAESLPVPLRKLLFRQIQNLEGSEYKYSYEFQPWSKGIKTFEMGNITGGKPFRSTTTIKGDILPKERYERQRTPGEYQEAIDHYVDNAAEAEMDIFPYETLEDLPQQEAQDIINQQKQYVHQQIKSWWDSLSEEEKAKHVPKIIQAFVPTDIYLNTKRFNTPQNWWTIENKK